MDPSENLLLAYDLDATGLGAMGGRATYGGGASDSEYDDFADVADFADFADFADGASGSEYDDFADFAANLERLAGELREYDRSEREDRAEGGEARGAADSEPDLAESRTAMSGSPPSRRPLLADLIQTRGDSPGPSPPGRSFGLPDLIRPSEPRGAREHEGGPDFRGPAASARAPCSCGILAAVIALELPSDQSDDSSSEDEAASPGFLDLEPVYPSARGDNLAEPDGAQCLEMMPRTSGTPAEKRRNLLDLMAAAEAH